MVRLGNARSVLCRSAKLNLTHTRREMGDMMNIHSRFAIRFVSLALAALAWIAAATPFPALAAPANFEIRTLSNRADLISDGDALVEVRVPGNLHFDKVTLTLNGADVTASFVADANAGTLRGVLRGMMPGDNHFVADSN